MKTFGRTVFALAAVISAGIFSRTAVGRLPFADKAFGDVLWATAFYLGFILVIPRLPIAAAVGMTIVITFGIEFLKLCHAQWLESIRATGVGGVILGHAFFWHDFLSYILGTALGVFLDQWVLRKGSRFAIDEAGGA